MKKKINKTNWKESVKKEKNNPVIIKLRKKIAINLTFWFLALVLALAAGAVLTYFAISKEWENPKKIIAIALPWVVAAILLVMCIIIALGNKIGVVSHKQQKIIFYSGINSNLLYVDGVLTTKGSNEDQLRCTLNDGSVLDIVFRLVDFDILIRDPNEIKDLPAQPIDLKNGSTGQVTIEQIPAAEQK